MFAGRRRCGDPLGGAIVESSPERLLATFGRLDAATAFARAVQEGGQSSDQAPLAIGINLGALSGTESERDIAFADRLRGRAGPGEICISAVTSDRLTSRFRPGRETTIALRALLAASRKARAVGIPDR